jgi:hypothetical protein
MKLKNLKELKLEDQMVDPHTEKGVAFKRN